jgi:CBS domain-containing protein
MFDFDVLGVSELDETPLGAVLGLGTVHLGARVADVARPPALTLAPETSLGAAVDAINRSARGAAVIVRNQRPVGVVTSRDLLSYVTTENRGLSIVAIMTACREPLRASDTVGAALRHMCATQQWHLPLVCARGLFLGALDVTDLTTWVRDRMTLLSIDAALGGDWPAGTDDARLAG